MLKDSYPSKISIVCYEKKNTCVFLVFLWAELVMNFYEFFVGFNCFDKTLKCAILALTSSSGFPSSITLPLLITIILSQVITVSSLCAITTQYIL